MSLLRVVALASLAALAAVSVSLAAREPAASPREKQALARVNDETLTLGDLERELGALHSGAEEGRPLVQKPNPAALLDRLIGIRLILQEARNIGLQDLSEVQDALKSFSADTLKEMLFGRQVVGLTPDPARVEPLYRERVQEWKLTSTFFEKDDQAKAFATAANTAPDYTALSKEWVAAGKAKSRTEAEWASPGKLSTQLSDAVGRIKPGELTPPVKVKGGFLVVKFLDRRYPENAEARKAAEQDVLKDQQMARIIEYVEGLKRQYTTIDQKLLDSLDYESKTPGFDKLVQDKRPLVLIAGESPLTVGELSEAIRGRFFHSLQGAIERKRVNRTKAEVLDDMLNRRVVIKEAKRLKIDQSEQYKTAMKEQEEGLLFGMFVEKVIKPEIKATDDELKEYVKDHGKDFTTPAMIHLEALAFTTKPDAEAALEKLRRGAGFAWTKANAPGQADPKGEKDLLEFPPNPVLVSVLPESVAKVVSGARSGDYRLFGEPAGPAYVLHVAESIPPRQKSFDEVKGDVSKLVRAQKLQQGIEDWGGKLRQASDVEVLVSPEQLNQLVRDETRAP